MKDDRLTDHRRLYRGLDDLRRLGFELERLWARMERHPEWAHQPEAKRRALRALVDVPLEGQRNDADGVERDVRQLTVRLVRLTRAWRQLEDERSLP